MFNMRLKHFKHRLCMAVTTLALGIAVLAGVEADAATLRIEPLERTKQTVSVGRTINTGTVMNLKINGKSYSKYKKKIKTVRTYYDPQYITVSGDKIIYVDNEFVPDSEDYKQKTDENYKYMGGGKYELTFLKPGTYKISYDVYEITRGKTKWNPDGIAGTVTYDLTKTHHEDSYKVVTTTDPIKSFTLGKNKITNTYKSSGTKYSCKTVTKYRYLKGKRGKLSIKANKNYKITSAFAVTYNTNGDVVVTASGNKKYVTYSTGKKVTKTEKEQYVLDANGNYTYVPDANGNPTDIIQSQMITTATQTSKYKPTEIHYGYKDTYTGSYTNYAVSTKQVYVRRKDEQKHDMYEQNPNGGYAKDERGNLKYVVDPVTATVIRKTYPERTIVDGVYATVTVVEELVVLPGAKSIYEDAKYYLDAACRGQAFYAGEYELVSKAGVNRYEYVTLEDGRVKRYENPVYNRKFYEAEYEGAWQIASEQDKDCVESVSDRTIDLKTGKTTITTRYKWVKKIDTQNNQLIVVKDHNVIETTPLDSIQTFNMK
ncbi:MAG: hypothetical protein PUC12_17015 [Clostridiales bacterium]|nr:hypothetical protein [Clostridiales bacterium]